MVQTPTPPTHLPPGQRSFSRDASIYVKPILSYRGPASGRPSRLVSEGGFFKPQWNANLSVVLWNPEILCGTYVSSDI